jgi:hypothetical protein
MRRGTFSNGQSDTDSNSCSPPYPIETFKKAESPADFSYIYHFQYIPYIPIFESEGLRSNDLSYLHTRPAGLIVNLSRTNSLLSLSLSTSFFFSIPLRKAILSIELKIKFGLVIAADSVFWHKRVHIDESI